MDIKMNPIVIVIVHTSFSLLFPFYSQEMNVYLLDGSEKVTARGENLKRRFREISWNSFELSRAVKWWTTIFQQSERESRSNLMSKDFPSFGKQKVPQLKRNPSKSFSLLTQHWNSQNEARSSNNSGKFINYKYSLELINLRWIERTNKRQS